MGSMNILKDHIENGEVLIDVIARDFENSKEEC